MRACSGFWYYGAVILIGAESGTVTHSQTDGYQCPPGIRNPSRSTGYRLVWRHPSRGWAGRAAEAQYRGGTYGYFADTTREHGKTPSGCSAIAWRHCCSPAGHRRTDQGRFQHHQLEQPKAPAFGALRVVRTSTRLRPGGAGSFLSNERDIRVTHIMSLTCRTLHNTYNSVKTF